MISSPYLLRRTQNNRVCPECFAFFYWPEMLLCSHVALLCEHGCWAERSRDMAALGNMPFAGVRHVGNSNGR